MQGFKIALKSVKRLAIIIVVMMTIIMSKTYYFGVANRQVSQYVYYSVMMISLLIIGINIKRLTKSVLLIMPIIILMILNILLHFTDMASQDVNQVIGNILVFICAAIGVTTIKKTEFMKYYMNFMFFICLISIPCYIIAITNENLAYSLCQQGYDWRTSVGYSAFYTWGWNGTIFKRNSGPFWEPGAFQGFIIIALLCLIFYPHLIKRKKIYFVVYIITIITTASTTGYILLLLILFTQLNRIESVLHIKGQRIKYLITTFVVLISAYIVISSGNISEKLVFNSNESIIIRYKDFLGGIALIARGGVFGLGQTARCTQLKMLLGINIDDSVGLFSMTYVYGIVFSLYYIIIMLRGFIMYNSNCKRNDMIVLTAIFLILHLTEGLWNLPVYLMIQLYGWFEDRNYYERNGAMQHERHFN